MLARLEPSVSGRKRKKAVFPNPTRRTLGFRTQSRVSLPRAGNFRCPSHPFDVCGTGGFSYSVLLGPHSLFDTSGVGKNWEKLAKDPEKNVLRQMLIVERTMPVCWMKPDEKIDEEIAFNDGINGRAQRDNTTFETSHFNGTGSTHTEGACAALANGSIQYYMTSTKQHSAELGPNLA